jgi:hypothetical protein
MRYQMLTNRTRLRPGSMLFVAWATRCGPPAMLSVGQAFAARESGDTGHSE